MMAISKRKQSLIHITLIVLVLIVAVLLLVLPSQVSGKTPSSSSQSRSPLITNQHQDISPSRDYSQSERRIRDQERRIDEARRDVDSARLDLWDAYTPSSINRSTTRYYNIQRAQSELDQAMSNLRMQDSDLYMQKRILESNQREQRLQDQRDQMRYHNAFDPQR